MTIMVEESVVRFAEREKQPDSTLPKAPQPVLLNNCREFSSWPGSTEAEITGEFPEYFVGPRSLQEWRISLEGSDYQASCVDSTPTTHRLPVSRFYAEQGITRRRRYD